MIDGKVKRRDENFVSKEVVEIYLAKFSKRYRPKQKANEAQQYIYYTEVTIQLHWRGLTSLKLHTNLLLHLPLHHGPVSVALEAVNDNLLDEHGRCSSCTRAENE